MCTITGNNLFDQWRTNNNIITQFCDVPHNIPEEDTCTVIDRLKIVEIYWSYNIYKTEDSFYISGIWGGREVKLMKITLPSLCKCDAHKILITGNDYYLFIVEKEIGKLWIKDEEDCVKEIHFNEMPINTSLKKKKEDSKMRKVKACGENVLCLTDSGVVYSGMLPGLVNTDHCLGSVCDIDCGFEHLMMLTDAGRVYTWGNGRRLQLGHGDLDNLETPTEIEALAGIKIIKICAGGWHSAALSEFGDLYVWGWNDMGQLGIRSKNDQITDDTLTSRTLPSLIDIYDSDENIVDLNVIDIACGSRHTALILEDNSVWTSGCNKYGQLGFDPSLFPTVNSFKKAYNCKLNSKILCGPWTTVLEEL